MDTTDHYTFFYQRRWPNGFKCPRCDYDSCYTISTRKMPLYQCRLCKHQTTLTAGTVMERSRTSLAKWAAAIELLASTSGINATQLSAEIGVSHKSAWLMLRSFRRAISESETNRKLQGTVRAGLRCLGRYLFHPHVRYRGEQVVIVSASMEPKSGEPDTLKIRAVSSEHLEAKRLTRQGATSFFNNHVHSHADDTVLLTHVPMLSSPLRHRFDEAARWLNRLFHGLGPAYLQSYLDEYCFRWNAQSHRLSIRDEWFKVCFRSF
jgi:transposase-like protein